MNIKPIITKVLVFVNNNPPSKRVLGAILILLGGVITAIVALNPIGKDLAGETLLISPLFVTGGTLYGIDVYHSIALAKTTNTQSDNIIT